MLVRGIQLRVRPKKTFLHHIFTTSQTGEVLKGELSQWLGQVDDQAESYPISGCKAIIAPFVGVIQPLLSSSYRWCEHISAFIDMLATLILALRLLGLIRALTLLTCSYSLHIPMVSETFGLIRDSASVFLSWVLRTIIIFKAVPCPSVQSIRRLAGIYRSM